MQDLVRVAMGEGALGVGASLIYPPAAFAETPEVVALAQAAAESGGGYVAHMRSEADRFLEALDETIDVARATGQRAEAYHLKAAGERSDEPTFELQSLIRISYAGLRSKKIK